jgi:acyl-CoA thioesterase
LRNADKYLHSTCSFYLLSAVPKALGVMRKLKMMASLDHSMWFYDDFDVHDWILYVVSLSSFLPSQKQC